MAAIKLDAVTAGLDDKAKHALLVIAARCPDRYTYTVTRSLPALARDMGVSDRTALRAILRLERKGYIQVTHKVGTTSTLLTRYPCQVVQGLPVTL